MPDSADISNAAIRLQSALTALEESVSPLLAKVSRLEKAAGDSQAFTEDRARLASELDLAKSENEKLAEQSERYQNREAEFQRLADATTQELDRVIADVERALAKGA